MTLPSNTSGKPQTITFPAIGDVSADAWEVGLAATSDAGLRVRYFVREGPAEVEGATLKLTAIPPRAKFPVKVTVVAWQLGNREFNAATPVEHTILLAR